MKMTPIYLIPLLIFSISNANAQLPIPQALWNYTYGGFSSESCHAICAAADGGFVFTGFTYSSGFPGNGDMPLLKVGSQGQLQWYRLFGGSNAEEGNAIIATADGGYALAGFTMSYGAGQSDMYLVKTDSLGNQQWQRTFGGAGFENCYALEQTFDGGFILGGSAGSTTTDDFFIVKTDSLGNQQWQQFYGGPYVESCKTLLQLSDGGYVFAGRYVYNSQGSTDMWLIRTDTEGDIIWQAFCGTPDENEWCYSLQQTSDGGFILGGLTTAGLGNYDMCLIKTDCQGVTQWLHNYGLNASDECYAVLETPDHGYIMGGHYNGDFGVVKTDSLGNELWVQTFNLASGDHLLDMCQAQDGTFGLAGVVSPSYNQEMWVVHMAGLQQAWINMQPLTPQITIPPAGGSFQFNVSLTNCGTIPCTPDAWIMVQLPSGSWYGPVLGPVALTLPTGGNLTRLRTQNVPGSAPAGTYTYRGYVGDYPAARWDSSSFTFEKLGIGDLELGAGDWSNTGQAFGENDEAFITHHSSLITSVSPNPFNATTAISYKLQAPSHVNLGIYDTAGRLVQTLADGWRDAGRHDVTFDGSHLPSGIYLYRIAAGEYSASGKMVLLK